MQTTSIFIMKKTYALVINESRDLTIAKAVSELFADYTDRRVPLKDFKIDLSRRLKQRNLVEVIRLEKTPLKVVEDKYKGTAYRVIDDEVYQIDPNP